MAKRKNKLFKSNFFVYGIISIMLHSFLLLFFLPNQNTVKKKLKPNRKFSIRLKKKKKRKDKEISYPPKKKKIDLKNKQIVDITKPKLEKMPNKAKYLAKYNSKTKKETKSKKRNKIIKKKVDSKDKAVPYPVSKAVPYPPKKAIAHPVSNRRRSNATTVPDVALQHRPSKDKAVPYPVSKAVPYPPNKVKLKLSDLQFSKMLNSASNDYLKDTKEGEYTSLNTLAYEYTGYFIKIKNKVSQNWNPAAAYQKYDPYRKLYGIKDRYTVLLITIDKKGYLKKIKVQKSCGLSFLDKEAITAFEKGQPYNIVPKGILKGKDEFTIQFGFYVDNPSSPRVFYLK